LNVKFIKFYGVKAPDLHTGSSDHILITPIIKPQHHTLLNSVASVHVWASFCSEMHNYIAEKAGLKIYHAFTTLITCR